MKEKSTNCNVLNAIDVEGIYADLDWTEEFDKFRQEYIDQMGIEEEFKYFTPECREWVHNWYKRKASHISSCTNKECKRIFQEYKNDKFLRQYV